MILINRFIKVGLLFTIGVFTVISGFAQQPEAVKQIMWEPVDISQRNVFEGPGQGQFKSDFKDLMLIGKQQGGTQLKYRLKDRTGTEWVAKVGRETQPETAATRLLWSIGYRTEINYLVKSLSIPTLGNYKNVRLEARPEKVKRLDKWSWTDNPFIDSNEFGGLKLMMAMFNNWDIKDENTAVLKEGDTQYFIISDLGATFGKLPEVSGKKTGRTVGKPEQYAQTNFIRQVSDGVIELEYKGQADYLFKGVKVEHGRWLASLLTQLTDQQIEDAFRAANYDDDDVKLLAQAFKARIKQLDEATQSEMPMAEKNN